MSDGHQNGNSIVELPREWRRDKIARLCDFVGSGGTPPTGNPDFYDGAIPWVQTGDLEDDWLDETAKTITDEGLRHSAARLYPRDTLLVAMYGATIGKLGILKFSAAVNQACCALVVRKTMDMRFMFYTLKSLRADLIAEALGGGQQNIGQETIKQTYVIYPPLAVQQRIAAYLDASCAAIDAAVAAKRRQLETLDALRKSIIAQSVTKGLNQRAQQRDSGVEWFGEIPTHWRCEHLKRFTTRIQTGCTPPTDTPDYYFDGTIPWFAPGSYDGDVELRESRKLINELARHEGVLRMFPGETVFLVGIGATIGKVGLIRQEAACNQQIIGIVSNHRMMGRYLAYQFKIYEDVIPGIASATTLPIFDQVKTGYLPTLQPPRTEQEAICVFLDAKLVEMKRLVGGIESQIATLTAYRKSLIHECVTGQRRITEADSAGSPQADVTAAQRVEPSLSNLRQI